MCTDREPKKKLLNVKLMESHDRREKTQRDK